MIAVAVPGAAISTMAGGYLPFCVEKPESLTWARDFVVSTAAPSARHEIALVVVETAAAEHDPAFAPFESVGPPAAELHATAMVSVLVDRSFGILTDHPSIRVTQISAGGDQDPDLARALRAAMAFGGLSSDGTKVTEPSKRAVITMSLGGKPRLRQTQALIERATATGHVLVVAAAGNDGPNSPVGRPAAFRDTVAVGGVQPDGATWVGEAGEGSAAGPELDVLGPSCQIPIRIGTAVVPGDVKATGIARFPDRTVPEGVRVSNGTSEATQFVGAAAALWWSAQPSLHSRQLAQVLELSGGETHTSQRGFGPVRLAAIPVDNNVPVVALKKRASQLAVTVTDRSIATRVRSDGTPVPGLPRSGIAGISIDFDTGPDQLIATSDVYRLGGCGVCVTVAIPPGASTVTVRAIDSDAAARAVDPWDGASGQYGEARLSWGPGATSRPPSTSGSTGPVVSSTTRPGTTTTASKIRPERLAAARESFRPFANELEQFMTDLRAAFPPSMVPLRRSSERETFRAWDLRLQDIQVRLDSKTRTVKSDFDLNAWEVDALNPYFVSAPTALTSIPVAWSGARYEVQPLSTQKYYEYQFKVLAYHRDIVLATVNGTRWPSYPTGP